MNMLVQPVVLKKTCSCGIRYTVVNRDAENTCIPNSEMCSFCFDAVVIEVVYGDKLEDDEECELCGR